MTDSVQIGDILRNVTLQRRKGDALARAGRDEEAAQAYNLALSLLEGALENIPASIFDSDPGTLTSRSDIAADAAELFGLRGGLLRRLGRLDEALESYRRGATIEYRYDLPSTYNRTNAIKLAPITGDRTIEQLIPELERFEDVLSRRLSTDERAADDAWAWADLGDIRLLLGDDVGAGSAYRTFKAKARTDSPKVTLSVLREIADALGAHGDREAARIETSLNSLEQLLG